MPFRRDLMIPTLITAAIVAMLVPQAGALNPVREYRQTPEQANIAYIDVGIETPDGIHLHGWFMPFQDQEGNPDLRPGPIVILPAPDDGNMGDLLWHYFRFFRGTPWHVLLFDWRGYGTSDRWPLEQDSIIVAEFITDLHAAIDFTKTRPEWDESHIGIYAFNVGAAVSLAVVSTRDDVDCLAIRGVYTNQQDLAAAAQAIDADRTPLLNEEYPARLEPLAIAPKVTVPTWIIAGENDQLTTPAMGRRVYEALGGKRQYWLAEGAGHTGGEMPESVQMQQFTARLHAFLRRHLGAAIF